MKIKLKLTYLLLIVVFIHQNAEAQKRLPSGSTYKDVLIATVKDLDEDFQLRSNVYLPEEASEKPWPLLLYIHGNGGAYNFANGSRSYELTIELADKGIAVATVDYRPRTGLPGNIYDVKAYIRYFRANAEKYNIDPERIGIWGTSRGGNLSTIIATTGDSPEHEGEVGGNLEQSSKVCCAVIYYPFISSLPQPNGRGTVAFQSEIKQDDLAEITKTSENKDKSSPFWKYVEQINLCNALNYVDENDPPVFLAHGSEDRVCLPQNSIDLYAAFVEAKIPAWLQLFSLGPHGIVSPQIEKASQNWILEMLLQQEKR